MNANSLYVVAPAKSDPTWELKRAITLEIAAELGFDCYYPEYDIKNPSFELARELDALKHSEAAIVDLSLERPSCYYELGIIEALKVRVKIFAENGTPIHQTSKRSTVCFYRDLEHYKKLFRDELYALTIPL